ncbi:MAG TPA: FAD-dependent oxidoreductase [Micromonosporaceae bacterium]|nr:FAD-dependent oxidoreductase [Micromonosporaceae bacterium]
MRTDARVVIVGGGVAGCSIAYHLARLGWTEVVVVERHDLGDGTTWHSAGFVGQLRSTISQTQLIMYSSALYAELAARTGLDPGWRGVGGIRLATTGERVDELRRQVSAATTYGLSMSLLGARETANLLPLLDVTDVRLAGWLPGDGYLRPEALTAALATGARALGVEFATHTEVTGVEVAAGAVRAARTDRGRIATDVVVNAAGAAAGSVGRLAGVAVPVVGMKHQYVVTAPLGESIVDAMPTVRDPDHIVYFRGEGTGLLVGGYVRTPGVCWPDHTAAPLAAPRTLFPADLDQFAEPWAAVQRRIPKLSTVPIERVVHGPEAFTPDGEFLLGETEVRGFWVAAGFCVHGLATAGGVGKAMAEWIVDGTPEHDVSQMDIRRFGPHAASRSWSTARALDAYARYYDVVYPHDEWTATRPLRRSATWPRLEPLGASLGEKAGWERVNWFDANAGSGDPARRPAGWAGRVWSPAIEAECRATADAAGLFDQSSFAKLDVRGTGSAGFLQWTCANDVDRSIGTVVYTQLLNDRAGIVADVTVTRLAEAHFRIVTSTGSGARDLAWLRRTVPAEVSIVDVTGGYGCLCLWGPRARDILQPLTESSLSNEDFRYLRARSIVIGAVPVLAQRVTFVGELGWELYAPADYVLTLWDTLIEAGAPYGLVPCGYRAIDALRLEKGYRVWGSDITPDTTPDEAGLSFAVRVDKDFRGRDALLAARAAGPPARTLRCLVLDDPHAVCLGTEPVRVRGQLCGRVTSGGFGYRVGASIAYAYLPSTVDTGSQVEVGLFGTWVGATVRAEPLYDRGNARIRG